MGWVRRPRGGRGWEARYRGSDRRERSRTFRTKAEAQRFLANVEAQMQRGDWRDPALARTTFEAWADEWMATTVHLRPATRYLYAYLLRCHVLPRFGPCQLGRITPVDVRSWLAELSSTGLSPSTVRKAFRVLSRALGSAVECGLIGHSPCVSVKPPPEPSHEMRFLNAQEVAELAEAIGPDYEVLVYTAAYTGLRWGELAGLRRKHVDLMRRTITVVEQLTEVNGAFAFGPPKTKAGQRRVAVPRFVVDHLERQLADRSEAGPGGLVFPAAEGGPMRRSNFGRRAWQPARRAVGLDGVRFHDLRHTAVALAIEAGAHPRALMERLGHSSITVTLGRYGHLLPGQDEAIADRLEAAHLDRATATSSMPTAVQLALAEPVE
jgi:integrase